MSFSVFYYISSREDDKGTELIMLIISAMCLFIFIINYHSIIKETNRHYIGVYNLIDGKNNIVLSYGDVKKSIEIDIFNSDKLIDLSKE